MEEVVRLVRMATVIRATRKQLGLTRKEMALAAGISETFFHYIDTGKAVASPERRAKIAAVLNIPSDKLFDEDGLARRVKL